MIRATFFGAAVLMLASVSLAVAAPDLANLSIGDLQERFAAHTVSSEAIVRAYLARIALLDHVGPQLNSLISLSPTALADAAQIDHAGWTGPLAGVSILIKDNIETAGPMPTTAGSLALRENVSGQDAPLVARLRAAHAVILGKTNLSEWANIRSTHSISGWSAVGGLVRNPYVLDRSACGSSAGSAAAVAAGLAAAAIGTETNGSITCPASASGLVGLKPTVGLISRNRIVPISFTQDTAGPMTRTVEDAATVLTVIAGSDPADPASRAADGYKIDYAAGLKTATLKGKRLGLMVSWTGIDPRADMVFAGAVATLREEGAEVIEIENYHQPKALSADETVILATELKAALNAYLAGAPLAVKTRTLAALIAFDQATPRETALFGDEFFEMAEKTDGLDAPAYRAALAEAKRLAGPEGIDKLLADNRLDALIGPTESPASLLDTVAGDHFSGSAATLAAVAGYPHLTVPMGQVEGLPVGLSFIGPAWSEASILQLGYAFEQATHARRPPMFIPSLEASSAAATALAPTPGWSGVRF